MPATTIKVSRELRDRLAVIAAAQQTTLAGAIESALNANAERQFWANVAQTMGGAAVAERADLDEGLADGLDPHESWVGVW